MQAQLSDINNAFAKIEKGELCFSAEGHEDYSNGYWSSEWIWGYEDDKGIGNSGAFVFILPQNTPNGYENTMKAFEQSMKNLDMDYLDLYLIHWPNPIKYRKEWQAANAGSIGLPICQTR